VYRLLAGREAGIAGEVVTMVADIYLSLLWAGMAVTLLVALLAGWLLSPARLERAAARARALLLAPSATALALAATTTTVLLASAFTLLVLEGKPSIIDAIVQLLHARYIAAGLPAGPASFMNEFWHIQNSLITERGWVSQYPPGHVLLLALGFRAGAVWLVGPLLAGVTVLFTTLAAIRLLPERPATARLGALLLALSPFLICLGGSFMNHITSAAMYAIALYCGVRARDGRAWWAAGAGAALGYAFMVRPVSALAVGAALGLSLWWTSLERGALRALAHRIALAMAGALPFVAALLAYNAHFFGGPLRLGYNVALGPAMALGFHRDPWGNVYGPLEALSYTASDLLTLGVSLLETPVSAVMVVGIWLMLARTVPRGARVFGAWALVLVVSNAFYWHHGIYMGPRMLLEAAPGWVLLATVAGTELASRAAPAAARLGRFSPRAAVGGGLAFALLYGLVVLAPQRARSYGGDWIPIARLPLPRVEGPSLVFVHDAWIGRLGMRLAVAGMSLDSVETMVRQNPTCLVHAHMDDLVSRDPARRARALARLDMSPRARDLPVELEVAPGDKVRVRRGEVLAGECLREARSDARGILDIAPFIWQADVPGVAGDGALFVRDLGPAANARLIAALPERTPFVWYLARPDADPRLVPYAAGMRAIWGGSEPASP
jgi:4-amino-4-deoxy-L-arabinose transferase-like glycosyltransferase